MSLNSIWDLLPFQKEKENKIEQTLLKVPLFANLTSKESQLLQDIVHRRHYAKGELIFQEGDVGNGMYIILEGKVHIFQGEQKESITHLQNGEFFGELSLVDGSPRSASIEASSESTLLGFFKPDLLEIINNNPQLGSKILLNLSIILAQRLRHTNKQLGK